VTIDSADVVAAGSRIASYIRRTPVVELAPDPRWGDATLVLKLESLQHTGSFKVRGAFNRILAVPVAARFGVIAASGGNHGLAVAFACRRLGLAAEIFVPETAAPVKVAALGASGATVTVAGRHYADAYEQMRRRAAQTGALVVHAYDDALVAAGQGTVGLELFEQGRPVDSVLLAVGGGGLLAGVATAIAGRARVIGVEPETIPTLHAALAAGHPVDVDVGGVAADSLGARRLGDVGFAVAQREAVGSVLVSDDAILAARRLLWRELRIVAEAGGAAALAAVLTGVVEPRRGERIAALVCGGNTDPGDLVSAER
jgi:threonine dehydratase